VQLLAGNNTLTFMRSTEASAPVAIKGFFLYITKPDIPAPATNYTPPPPAPRPDKFIEVPATTTCAKQGITDVPSSFCKQACESFSLKFAGEKPFANMTGCFALTAGAPKGLCAFNTNASATVCPQQPCTVNGGVAQQICLRAGGREVGGAV